MAYPLETKLSLEAGNRSSVLDLAFVSLTITDQNGAVLTFASGTLEGSDIDAFALAILKRRNWSGRIGSNYTVAAGEAGAIEEKQKCAV
jgi:hypothetical protein